MGILLQAEVAPLMMVGGAADCFFLKIFKAFRETMTLKRRLQFFQAGCCLESCVVYMDVIRNLSGQILDAQSESVSGIIEVPIFWGSNNANVW